MLDWRNWTQYWYEDFEKLRKLSLEYIKVILVVFDVTVGSKYSFVTVEENQFINDIFMYYILLLKLDIVILLS